MRFNVPSVLLTLALYSSTISARALPSDSLDCRELAFGNSHIVQENGHGIELLKRAPVDPPIVPKPDPGTHPEPNPSEGPAGPSQEPGSTSPGTEGEPPINPNQPITLQNPQFPQLKDTFMDTVRWLEASPDHLPKGSIAHLSEDESVFYSGEDSEEVQDAADNYAEKNNKHTISIFKDCPVTQNFLKLMDEHPDTDLSDAFNEIQYAAFAKASSGEVFMMLDPSGIFEDTYLAKVEWPELVNNPEVTKITWINSQDIKETKVIWNKNQGPIQCPVGVPTADLHG